MCGIAGWLGHVADGPRISDSMRKTLHHRGPDGSGIKAFVCGTLVHTRLSIIDLSPEGAQPMSSADGQVWVVLNGEIYNHRALRHQLEADGGRFRGHSDTEVIAPLYQKYGLDFVRHLRGMFAIALLDLSQQRLVLVRDRFGIKPLFYTTDGTRLAFASEIRALRQLPDLDDRASHQAIYDYMALSYMAAPDTLFDGIKALEPCMGLQAWWNGNSVRLEQWRYHQWAVVPNGALTLDTAVSQAEGLITEAVRGQMESDVPLGSLLSGGIDSSLVSAAAQRASGHLKTFNVRFPGDYDETWAAVAVARHIQSEHHTLDMDLGEANWERVAGLLSRTGQPFADTSLFAVHGVSRLMRQHVTVALSGDGGDEGFGGYDVSWRLGRFARLQQIPAGVWRLAHAAAIPLARRGMVRAWLPERLADIPNADDALILRNMCGVLREREQEAVFEGQRFESTRRLFESRWPNELGRGASRAEHLAAQFTEANIRLILANDYLFKVDAASMHESIEIRVPMLNEDLVEFGLTVPHHLNVRRRIGKRVLRGVARRWLPPKVAAKPKAGFRIPIDAWVTSAFKQRLRETLLGATSPLRDLLSVNVYRRWIEAFCSGTLLPDTPRDVLYRRAILLLSLHLSLCPDER
jgi:asparagine synthase (glutamine-hydrolysing)